MYASCQEEERVKRTISVLVDRKDPVPNEELGAYFYRCSSIKYSCGYVEVDGSLVLYGALDSRYSITAVTKDLIRFSSDWLEGYMLDGTIDRRSGVIKISQRSRYNPLTERRHIHPIQPSLYGSCQKKQRVM